MNAAGIAKSRNASARPWAPPASESRAASTSMAGSRRRVILRKLRPQLGRSFTLSAATCKREEIDGRSVADLAGTRLIPPRFARRQARLRRSVARQPEVSGVGEEPGALRRDRGHARPFGPPRLGRRDHAEGRSGADRGPGRVERLAAGT